MLYAILPCVSIFSLYNLLNLSTFYNVTIGEHFQAHLFEGLKVEYFKELISNKNKSSELHGNLFFM